MMKDFSFLQISDLHIFDSTLNTLQIDDFKKLGSKINPEFIVVSGDFRSLNGDSKYDHAKKYLEEVVLPTFNLDKEKVFFVPGNHDISSVDGNEKETIQKILKDMNDKNTDICENSLNYLYRRFEEYEKFVKDFYKESKVSDNRIVNPSGIYSYSVNNVFKLIFINTSLASCNRAFGEESELIDIKSFSRLIENEDKSIPSIIVAHHSFDHIYSKQRRIVNEICQRINVRAWICGDEHVERVNGAGIQVLGENTFPILVMGKTPIQSGDTFSNNSVVLYSYKFKEKILSPTVYTYNAGGGSSIGYHRSIEFKDKNDNPITIDLSKKDKTPEKKTNHQEKNIGELIDEYKKEIKNECIIPWAYKSYASFDAIFPKLFIRPSIQSLKKVKHYYNIDYIINFNNKDHIVFMGDAGVGKSTFLKYLFLFKSSAGLLFLYITASDLIKSDLNEESKQYEYIRYVRSIVDGNEKDNTVILIDAVDEGFKDDADKLNELLKKVESLKQTKVWFGWRKEHYYYFKNDLSQKLISEEINIREWDIKKAKKYVKKYSDNTKNKELNDIFLKCFEKNTNIDSFSKNPFQLTLLVYLIENEKEKILDSLSKISVYNLYDRFIELWINQETEEENRNDIVEKLTEIAREIYYKDEAIVSDINMNISAIRDLLQFSEENRAREFCHRSLAAYFVAREILQHMQNGGKELADSLRRTLKSDITGFIKSATLDYNDDCILKMQKNLMDLYNPKGSNELLDSYENEEKFSIKNELVYLVTRLRKVGNEREEYIREVNETENDVRMRVTIAYGAAALGLQDMVLSFAKEFYEDNSVLAHATRSFSLIYYGDVSKGSLYSYQDKGVEDWTKSREIRINNLKSRYKKYTDFRILDIPLLYSFYVSRKWKDVNRKDYYAICHTIIDTNCYTNEVYGFLKEKRLLLKNGFTKHLVLSK